LSILLVLSVGGANVDVIALPNQVAVAFADKQRVARPVNDVCKACRPVLHQEWTIPARVTISPVIHMIVVLAVGLPRARRIADGSRDDNAVVASMAFCCPIVIETIDLVRRGWAFIARHLDAQQFLVHAVI